MPLDIDIPLKGEFSSEDFSLDGWIEGEDPEHYDERITILFREVGMLGGLWLAPTIGGGYQWAGGDEFEAHKRDLADFFNSSVKGPYHVHIGYINARDIIDFVFMEKDDAQALVERFGEEFHYRLEEKNFTENLKYLASRHNKIGWVPKDERLLPYLEQALKM